MDDTIEEKLQKSLEAALEDFNFEISNLYDDYTVSTADSEFLDEKLGPPPCDHKFVGYQPLFGPEYEFCEKCDLRKT